MTDTTTPSHPSLWRRVTALYAKLLEVLLAACLAALIFPVTLQIVSRYTALIPSYIWTEEMARFLFIWTIVIAGIEFTRFAWNRTSELAELPLWLIHVAWPVAGFTWIVFAGEQIVDEANILFGRKP